MDDTSQTRSWTQTRFSRLVGVRYPIVQGPFGGGISSVALASAVTNAGGLGSFGVHHLDGDGIRATADAIRARTDGPFNLNLWILLPGERESRLARAAYDAAVELLRDDYVAVAADPPPFVATVLPDFDEQIAAILEARPAVFSFVFGIPEAAVMSALRDRGILTAGTATNVDEAVALDEAGVHVIVASGAEAGGHRVVFQGRVDEAPSVSALVPQVVDAVRAPVIVAGGIADGRGIAAALAYGAEGVQVGTSFLTTDESIAPAAHKAALLDITRNRRTVLTRSFSGRHARGQVNDFVERHRDHEDQFLPYPFHNWLTRPLRAAAADHDDAERLSLWSGQNAPLATSGPAGEVVTRLVAQTNAVLAGLASPNQGE